MAIEQTPQGWTDKSEHEDGELDYQFSIENNTRRATIYRHDWMGATAWTLNLTANMDKGIFFQSMNTAGEFENLSDAVARGENWLNSDATVWQV